MKDGISNIMKQAQEMQANIEQAKQEVAKSEVVGESGSGLIKVVMNGNHQVSRVEISPELMKDDKDIVEDLITAAINDASRLIEELTKEKMSQATARMGLPSGMKLPF